jgi:hypothetical protein
VDGAAEEKLGLLFLDELAVVAYFCQTHKRQSIQAGVRKEKKEGKPSTGCPKVLTLLLECVSNFF